METYQFVVIMNINASSAKTAKSFMHGLIEEGRKHVERSDDARVENHHIARCVDVEEWIPVRSIPAQGAKEGNPPVNEVLTQKP